MKKLFTLAAVGAMAAASFQANAQMTVDGILNSTEIGAATAGKYVLVGKFTNPHGFGDYGFLSLYAANTATKLYFFVAGTVENNPSGSKNSFQLFIDRPGVTGASASPTALPAPTAGVGTSFAGMTSKMDLAPDLALAIRGIGTANQLQAEAISYASATSATDRVLTSTLADNGTAATVSSTGSAAPFAALANARMAYRASTVLSTNPGYNATTTAATYGGAGSYGWEIEVDRTAMGLTTNGAVVNVFVLMNNDGGNYLSSDFIPQTTTPNGNLAGAASVDFGSAAIAGTQSAAVTVATVTAIKAADKAAVAMQIYPNPAQGVATVSYNVGSHADNVNIALTDLLGREVQVLANGLQAAGMQSKTVSTANVAAGTYLVRVQVGDKVSTSKMVVL